MEKPNIVYILTDQQRHNTCGCYGQELEVTPNLDVLAKKGIIFENAFTCQPVCGPARACLQTGRFATEIGCFRNEIALPISDENIANYFSNNGYEVGYIGKWHLASTLLPSQKSIKKNFDYTIKPIPPERRGGYKDFWLASDLLEFTSHGYEGHLFDGNMNKAEFKGYRVDCLTDFVLNYLGSRKSNKPLFLFVSYLEPHQQNNKKIFEAPIGSKERFKNFKIPGDLKDTEGDWRENLPEYLGCCHSIDNNLQRIQEKLEELGILRNAILFFSSDHGCHFKTRNWEYKRSCHESSIHIPLIVKGPGFQGGRKISELINLIDIAPTLLKCARIQIPKQMKGQPIQQLL